MTGFPIVDSVTPAHGPAAGGTSVTLAGRNFTGTTSVEFDGTGASFTVVDDNTITATTPAGSGSIDVVLVNATGSSDDGGTSILTDSSGNGNDGSYSGSGWVAGLVPDGAAAYENTQAFPSPWASAYNAAGFIDPSVACSVELWYQIPAGSPASVIDPLRAVWVVLRSDDGSQFVTFYCVVYDGVYFQYVSQLSVQGVSGSPIFFARTPLLSPPSGYLPIDSAGHQVVLTWMPDATTSMFTVDLDGSFVETLAVDSVGAAVAAPTFTEPLTTLEVFSNYGGIRYADVAIDELSVYPTSISGAAGSHFAAAGTSYAAYKAAVLADSPVAYYRFDDERRDGLFLYDRANGWHVGSLGVG